MSIDLIELATSKNLIYLIILIIFMAWDCARQILTFALASSCQNIFESLMYYGCVFLNLWGSYSQNLFSKCYDLVWLYDLDECLEITWPKTHLASFAHYVLFTTFIFSLF